MRKLVGLLLVLAILAGGGYVGLRAWQKSGQKQGDRPRGPAAVAVEITPVQYRTLRDVALFTGSLEADSRFIVASQVSGQLHELLVNIGDRVATSQPIAVIDDRSYAQQVEQALAEEAVALAAVAEAKSNLAVAQSEFNRTDALYKKEIASASVYEQAVAQLAVQKARCDLAQAQVDQKAAARREAEIKLSYTKINAIWQGGSKIRRIAERFINEGALLAPNSPIVSVVDIGTLVAAVFVPERDYAKISTSQPAVLTTDAYPGQSFPGWIERIAPQLQETSRQARVEVRVPNPDEKLRPGMFVRVRLDFAEHAEAQSVPAAAVVRRQGQRGVFVIDSAAGKAKFLPCEFGISEKIPQGPDRLPLDVVEVISPKLAGPVAVMGQHLLDDGSSVRVVDSVEVTTTRPGEARR